jgi:recombination protein RecA
VSEKASQELDYSAKKKSLEVVFSQIDKHYGKGSVMLLGQSTKQDIETISTGSLLLDQAIGINGFPRGRIIEVYGPEASGKTTIALQAIAQAQKTGGICAFIDAEHALDPSYALKLGINVNDLIISQPDYGEQALDIVEMLIRSAAIDLIVVDSVAALVPKAELEGDMGDLHVGLQARLMSQALRKLAPIVHKSKVILIFINQVRHNISAMPFANKEVTTGGNALKFYSSVRLEVRRIESLKDKDGHHKGNLIKVKVAKNKVAPPFKCIEVSLLFGEGISKHLELLDLALTHRIIGQTHSWFSFNGEKLAQGREQMHALLKQDDSLMRAIDEKVREALKVDSTKIDLREEQVK